MELQNKIVYLLKLKGPLSPNDIAQKLEISKTCAYNHISDLEEKDYLKKKLFKPRVGRPGYKFILTEKGNNYFNDHGCYMGDLLKFMVENDKRDIIGNFLKSMYRDIHSRYENSMSPGNITERARQIVSMRADDGYMATLVQHSDDELRIEQANCPIFRMAKLDNSACELETSMFRKLLGSEVKLAQNQIEGSGTCRFHVASR